MCGLALRALAACLVLSGCTYPVEAGTTPHLVSSVPRLSVTSPHDVLRRYVHANPPPRELFLSSYREALCAWYVACEGVWASAPPSAVIAACHPRGIDPPSDLHIPAVVFRPANASEWTYVPAVAAECLSSIARQQCVGMSAATEFYCGRVFGYVGARDDGCLSQPCSGDERCILPSSCPTCRASCEPPRLLGERCNAMSSSTFNECVEPLICVSGACAIPRQIGDPCSEWNQCIRGGACRAGVCVHAAPEYANYCEALCPGHEPCVTAQDLDACVRRAPRRGGCSADLRLVSRPALDAPPPRSCALGERCVQRECRRAVMPYSGCPDAVACPLGFHCGQGRCLPDPGLYESCDSQARCIQGDCVRGTCVGRPAGMSCNAPGDPPLTVCASGRCDPFSRRCL